MVCDMLAYNQRSDLLLTSTMAHRPHARGLQQPRRRTELRKTRDNGVSRPFVIMLRMRRVENAGCTPRTSGGKKGGGRCRGASIIPAGFCGIRSLLPIRLFESQKWGEHRSKSLTLL